jgi:hypothetical protein
LHRLWLSGIVCPTRVRHRREVAGLRHRDL